MPFVQTSTFLQEMEGVRKCADEEEVEVAVVADGEGGGGEGGSGGSSGSSERGKDTPAEGGEDERAMCVTVHLESGDVPSIATHVSVCAWHAPVLELERCIAPAATRLRTLDLSASALGTWHDDKAPGRLYAEMLSLLRGLPNLRELVVSSTWLGPAGVNAVRDALPLLPKLRVLEMAACCSAPIDAQFCAKLVFLPELRVLDVSHLAWRCPRAQNTLVRAIAGARRLQVLRAHGAFTCLSAIRLLAKSLRRKTGLRVLDIDACTIPSHSAREFARALSRLPALEWISLSSAAVVGSDELEEWESDGGDEEVLDLMVVEDVLPLLLSSLPTSVRCVHVANCHITEDVARNVGNAFSRLERLESVVMCRNALGDAGARIVAEALAAVPSFRALRLARDARMTDQGYKRVGEILGARFFA